MEQEALGCVVNGAQIQLRLLNGRTTMVLMRIWKLTALAMTVITAQIIVTLLRERKIVTTNNLIPADQVKGTQASPTDYLLGCL